MPTAPPTDEKAREEYKAYQSKWSGMYNSAQWRGVPHGLRIRTLARDPICKICKQRPSTVADHIKDHRGDLMLFADFANLQGLCASCHSEKTAAVWGFGGSPEKQVAIPANTFIVSALTAPEQEKVKATEQTPETKAEKKRLTDFGAGLLAHLCELREGS
jgi:hypothetical protein